jgi:putative ABC transport system ATP-binding protein
VSLRLEGVTAGYGAGGFRLDVPSLRVAAGEAVALMGPSGSGKSTLLLTAAGVLPALDGDVEVAGTTLARGGTPAPESVRRRTRLEAVGLVLQELELLEHVSVRDNVLLAWHLGAAPAPWPEAQGRAARLTARLGIERYLDRSPRALSQGERQRVAVARALAPAPRVLLADEPTANLDAANAARVVDALLAAAREDGAGLLLVTHDVEVARRMDRTLTLPAPRTGAA